MRWTPDELENELGQAVWDVHREQGERELRKMLDEDRGGLTPAVGGAEVDEDHPGPYVYIPYPNPSGPIDGPHRR